MAEKIESKLEDGVPSAIQMVEHAHKVRVLHGPEGHGLVAEFEEDGEREGDARDLGEEQDIHDGDSNHSSDHSIDSEFDVLAENDWPPTLVDNIHSVMEAKGILLTEPQKEALQILEKFELRFRKFGFMDTSSAGYDGMETEESAVDSLFQELRDGLEVLVFEGEESASEYSEGGSEEEEEWQGRRAEPRLRETLLRERFLRNIERGQEDGEVKDLETKGLEAKL